MMVMAKKPKKLRNGCAQSTDYLNTSFQMMVMDITLLFTMVHYTFVYYGTLHFCLLWYITLLFTMVHYTFVYYGTLHFCLLWYIALLFTMVMDIILLFAIISLADISSVCMHV